MGRHAVAAPCGSNEKVWPPCSFWNKEPSKTTVWLAYKTASPGAPRWPCSPMRFVCTGVGSCAWGVMPSPLHEVRMKRGTKATTSRARQQQQPQPSRTPPTKGVYVACVPASVRHACLFWCRLLQRGLHDSVCLLVSCLLVFVLHACSCLSRNLPRGQGGWPTGGLELEGQTGRGENQREVRKQPTRWSWRARRVEAEIRAKGGPSTQHAGARRCGPSGACPSAPWCSPSQGGCLPRGSPRLWGLLCFV